MLGWSAALVPEDEDQSRQDSFGRTGPIAATASGRIDRMQGGIVLLGLDCDERPFAASRTTLDPALPWRWDSAEKLQESPLVGHLSRQ